MWSCINNGENDGKKIVLWLFMNAMWLTVLQSNDMICLGVTYYKPVIWIAMCEKIVQKRPNVWVLGNNALLLLEPVSLVKQLGSINETQPLISNAFPWTLVTWLYARFLWLAYCKHEWSLKTYPGFFLFWLDGKTFADVYFFLLFSFYWRCTFY